VTGTQAISKRLDAQAQEAEQHAETIRRTLLSLVQSLQMDPA
jgi:hypothetical protein